VGEVLPYLFGAHLRGMTFLMEEDETPHMRDISLFGADAIMKQADVVAQAFEQWLSLR
jgi:hypothetical protein